jgi:protoporphyrinogen oxidase
MWEMCRDRLVAMGGTVLMRHAMTHIELVDGRATAVVAATPEGERRFEADHVISTTSVRSLVAALEHSCSTATASRVPEAVRRAADALKYRDFVVVALMLKRERLFPDNWIYIHSPGVKIGRIQNFNNWSKAMVPEPGMTCLGLEYFCFEGDEIWTTPDSTLIAEAAKDLERLGLASTSDVVDGTVIRMPKAYPIYDAAYRAHLDTIRRFIDPISNLHTVGRNGMHKYNNQDHSMLTAMMAVWNMEGASHDIWAVNSDFDYHEEQRLDDRQPLATVGAVR